MPAKTVNRRKKSLARLHKAGLIVMLVLIWQLLFYLTTSVFKVWKPYMFPNPLGTAQIFWKMIMNNTLGIAVFSSLRRVFIGFVLSVAVGGVFGFFLYKFKLFRELFRPILLGIQTLPSICWLPFAILWFGLNESAIMFVIVIGSAFSISIAVESGLCNVDPLLIKAGRTMGAARLKLFVYIILPASFPQLLIGLKQGWSFSWRALMNGETMSATIGLGQVLTLGRDLSDINQVMCVMLVIIILGVTIDHLLFGAIEKRMIKNRAGQ